MCNHYATTLGRAAVHAFTSKRERDEWVNDDWDHRDSDDAEIARYWVSQTGVLMLHGNTRVPRSWGTLGGLMWDYERTEDPDVDRAFLVW